jgi:di/tripeptidase
MDFGSRTSYAFFHQQMRIVWFALAVIAIFWVDVQAFAGAPTRPASSAASSAQKSGSPPKASLSDSQIEQDIRARLSKSKINSEHFLVSVRNGVATLEGKTSVIQHKGAATRIARTAGAVSVRNNIQVSAEARAASGLGKGAANAPRTAVLPAKPLL